MATAGGGGGDPGRAGEAEGGGGAVVTVTGRLRVVEVEGPHFEVEPWPDRAPPPPARGGRGPGGHKREGGDGEGASGGRYVLIPADEEVARLLAASVGGPVRVRGFRHEGPSIFMRGTVLRVTSVTPLDV